MSRHGRGSTRVVARISTLILLLSLMAPVGAQESAPGGDRDESSESVEDPQSAASKIDEELEKTFETQDEAQFLVMVEESDTSAGRGMADWEERGRFVYETLTRHAEETQAEVIADLDARGVEYKSFWIVNSVLVTGTSETALAMAQHPEVESVTLAKDYQIPEPEEVEPDNETRATEWGLEAINIPQVWDQFGARGEGIVVGVIDSGVQWDHPALVDQYRGNDNGNIDHEYNWYDPTRYCGDPSPEPCDLMGHGTHVTGTIVGDDGGDNQIGVAPEARFISAVGCDIVPDGCSTEALLGSGEWMAAPTDTEGNNPNPDMRPHIINNSWGGGHGDDWYMAIVDNWIDLGMFPQFASGNGPPVCGTAGSPGDYPQSYSTGGFDIDGEVYFNSGRGPSALDGGIKPNISAPAVNVRSSVPGDGYLSFTGTSMASPHVAGTVAVIWGASGALVGNIDATKDVLDQTAVDTEDLSCGGTAENNNVWGEGKLDALAAIQASPLGDVGTVAGTVTDTEGAPISGVTVSFDGAEFDADAITAEDGTYSIVLPIGDYAATASEYGYLSEPADVTVTANTTTTQDFSLAAAPSTTVTGTVTDGGGHGWPLYARIDVPEHPDSPFFTNPETGEYSIELLESTEYTFEVSAVVSGYVPETRAVTIPPEDLVQDFVLDVDVQACTAPGYDSDGVYETFDTDEVPEGWEVVDNIGNDQTWIFDNPRGRENLTGGEGNFAIVDSTWFGRDGEQDTELISPLVDYTQFENPSIEFLTYFADWEGDPEIAEVDLSLDNGATWETVWSESTDVEGAVVIDIPQAADATEARVRFHYYEATYAFWWQVDNVLLGELSCLPEEAGVVTGFVSDVDTGDPLVGATLAVDANPENAVETMATPDDPALDDGLYILTVLGTGETAITASMNHYDSSTETVNVVADDVVTQDFQLGTGLLEVTPESLETTLDMGETGTQELEIANNGSRAASFTISDADQEFVPAGEDTTPTPADLEPVDDSDPAPPASSEGDTPDSGVNAALEGAEQTGDQPQIQAIGDWNPAADLTGGAARYAKARCPGDFSGIYKIAGVDIEAQLSDETFWYDAGADTWTTLAPMPGGGREAPTAACSDAGRIHVVGGASGGTATDTHFVYNMASDSWEEAAPVPRELWTAASAIWDGKLYVAGGSNSTFLGVGVSDEVNVYDIATDTWEASAEPMPVAMSSMGYTQAGRYLYLVGGWGATSPGANETMTLRFDMEAGVWEIGPEFTSARADLGVAVTDSTLYAVGGDADGGGSFGGTDIVEQLDLSQWPDGEWVDATSLASPLSAMSALCAVGGSGPGIHNPGGVTPGPSIQDFHFVAPTIDESCGGGDANWLSEDPTEGTLQPGESTTVTVTFDASVPEVDQPGVYNANILVNEDGTPHSVPPVPVAMTVDAPTWGKVDVNVEGLGHCDSPGSTLAGATVEIADQSGETDAYGYLFRWIEEGTYPVSVSADGFVSDSDEVAVVAEETVAVDFSLRPELPCGEITPDALDFEVRPDETASDEITFTNDGAGELEFTIRERPASDDTEPADLEPVDESELAPPAPNGRDDAESGESQALAGTEQTGENPVIQDIGDWEARAPLIGGAVRFARVQCPGEFGGFYKISGVDTAAALSDETSWYDATTDDWTILTPMPGGREAPAAACTEDGRIHVLGGTDAGNPSTSHFVYDIATDTWEQAAPIPRDVWAAAAGTWNGKIYLVGGSNSTFVGVGNTAEVNVYDIATDTWEENAEPFPAPARLMGYAPAGQYLYVVGGSGDSAPSLESWTLRFDMDAGVWESGPDLPAARSDMGVAVTDTSLYAMGGDADGGGSFDATDVVTQLDLTQWPDGEWVDATSLPTPLSALGAACANGPDGPAIHAIGGTAPGPSITDVHSAATTDEGCELGDLDVPWLSVDPVEGTVPGDSTGASTVTVDTTDRDIGEYSAELRVRTNDSVTGLLTIPVNLSVIDPTPVIEEAPGEVERGDTVTLIGRNFLEPLEVNFGNTTITDANVSSETELTFDVPNNIRFGDYQVSVTTPEGISNEVTITVARPGGPSVPQITDHPDETMRGETVALGGSGFRGNVRVNFGDLTIRNVDVISETELTFVVPVNAPFGPTPTSVRAQGRTSNTVSIEVVDAPEPGPPSAEPPTEPPPTTEPPTTEPPTTEPPSEALGDLFGDVPTDHLFAEDIEWLADGGITIGCNPPENTMFCPEDSVTRGQMAGFLNRALDLPAAGTDHFSDDDSSVFEDDINRLAESGVTYGCNPPDNTWFCPNEVVIRQEMASFLVRGYDVTPGTGVDRFEDDDDSVHEADIEALAASGVTLGCNPPDNTLFCPLDDVIRGQMAAFLHRADPFKPSRELGGG